jgi:hypothetical protein
MNETPLRRRILQILHWSLLIPGLMVFCVGIAYAIYIEVFIQRSITTNGTIVRLQVDSQGGRTDYAPVFSFVAEDRSSYTVISGTESNPPAFTVGQPVRVIYLENNPATARLDTFLDLWFFPSVSCGLGFLFAAASFLLRLVEQRMYSNKLQILAIRHSQTSGP